MDRAANGDGRRALSEDERLGAKLGEYAGRIVAVAKALPDGPVCRHVRDQLVRSGTAPGANYAEARSAESRADFTHKVAVAAKEARESLYWLRVTRHSELVERDLGDTIALADRLVGWLYTSMRTAREATERD